MGNETIQKLQKRLAALGFNPGTADGLWGPKTRGALNQWQLRNGRKVTSTPSNEDIALLLSLQQKPVQEILWLNEAAHLMGLREGPGKVNNPVIMDWASQFDIHYPGDDIAWCGLFVAHTMRAALPDEPLPANILGARQYMKFGQQVGAQLGAVGVFWRGSKAGWQGHVGYLVGESPTTYIVLGGNQSDSVSYTSIAKDRLLGSYWPVSGPAPFNIPLPAKPTLKLSTNEA